VRHLEPSDWPAVEAIYREGIGTGHATFEKETPTWEVFIAGKVEGLSLVAELDGKVVGWAAASPVSSRAVYRGVVEHSVYIAAAVRGKGIGHLLVDALIDACEGAGVWTIQSSIFPENASSMALHAGHGFRVVGRRERIALMTYGPMAGEWRDTILIERRIPAQPVRQPPQKRQN
jgi:L-amino acid N-acyltransferase YncA